MYHIQHLCMMEKLLTLLLLNAIFGVCQGRVVTVTKEPVLRVEGQQVALRCDVSDYEGPSEQNFDWKVMRDLEAVQVISTFDPAYPDRSFEQRVLDGDISVVRLSDSAVELRIREAQVSDSATYRCSTPSTDVVFNGNYEADVQLKVITDSLVMTPEPLAPVVPEGGSLNLICNVTRNFVDGTYLSVAWSARKGTSPAEDVLTFGPDDAVTVGDGFRQRYAEGSVRLQLGQGGRYGLALRGVMPADQGKYVCTARQWTREQGGAWSSIQEKSVEMGDVAVTQTADSLVVKVQDAPALSTGDPLTLTCSVSADDLTTLGLEVTWLLDATRVLVHMGRDGVVADGSDVVSMRRVSQGDFRLTVRNVELSDSGLYTCRVRAWVRQSGETWYQAAEKTSSPTQVLVSQKDPGFAVSLVSPVMAQFSGDPAEFVCRVTNVSNLQGGRLGVAWLFSPTVPSDDPVTTHTVASLDESGTLRPGDAYLGRFEAGLISVTQSEADVFKLRLLRVTGADAGEYACRITAWKPSRHGNWDKAAEYQTSPLKISLTAKNPALRVVAQRVREVKASGATFEMSCRVTGENLQGAAFSVLVQSQEGLSGPVRNIASLSPDSAVRLEDGGEQNRQDGVTLAKTGPHEFQFRILGARVSDRGYYWCQVGAWTRQPGDDWVEVVKAKSNSIQIAFEHTGPSFSVSISSDTTGVFPWETAKMECVISVAGTPPSTDDVAYELRWYLSRLRGSDSPLLLGSVDRWGVVRKSPRNDSSDLSLERAGPRAFLLSVHSTQDSDAGEYHCTASPWVRLPGSGGTWNKEAEVTSERVFLNVKFALWDSMRLPLLYGVCASLSVGLFSLFLGLVCSHCCCRNTTNTPRSRTKLMDLEMD